MKLTERIGFSEKGFTDFAKQKREKQAAFVKKYHPEKTEEQINQLLDAIDRPVPKKRSKSKPTSSKGGSAKDSPDRPGSDKGEGGGTEEGASS